VCARGDGIRGSKDLQAEIEKYSNSTNERKQMSTKTLRKRIALVAISALTAGVVSVVATPSANAGEGQLVQTSNSIGLLAGATIVSTTTTTHTATLLSTGTLSLTLTGTGSFKVSAGATITSASSTSAITADQTAAYGVTTAAIRPTGAIGSTFTVSTYAGDDAATVAAQAAENVMTVTIAGASVAGVVSPSDSGVFWVAAASGTATADVDGEEKTTAGTLLYLDINLEDSYGAAIHFTVPHCRCTRDVRCTYC
jgi:hypothetical protein